MSEHTNEIAERATDLPGAFGSEGGFALAQRMARALSESKLIPDTYRGNIPDCLIALEMAQRVKASPLMVMQHLYVVHGRPAWSAQFLVATFNACGRFSSIRYQMERDDNGTAIACTAVAVELATGELLEGTRVTTEMAAAEGWSKRSGSKWLTMPEHMLRYRAATFLVRQVAPELSLGLATTDEAEDMAPSGPTGTDRARDAVLAAVGRAT